MKKLLLLITTILLSLTTQAQDYEALYGEEYVWNNDTETYDRTSASWGSLFFEYTDEYIKLGLNKEENPTKLWWAFYNKPKDDCECYYTEGDKLKICIYTQERKMIIYSNSIDDRFQNVWVLTKIKDLK